jgi:hypothetical protein
MIEQYQNNKELIHSQLEGRSDTMNNTTIMNLSILTFFAVFLFVIVAWIIGLYLLVRDWERLPDWVKVLGVASLIFGFPIITIILVLATTAKKGTDTVVPGETPLPTYGFGETSKFRFKRL